MYTMNDYFTEVFMRLIVIGNDTKFSSYSKVCFIGYEFELLVFNAIFNNISAIYRGGTTLVV
jgi:hypothetical protein